MEGEAATRSKRSAAQTHFRGAKGDYAQCRLSLRESAFAQSLRVAASRIVCVVFLLAGCAEERKSYMRHPLVREMKVMPAPANVPETSTQAEPFPPPRPVLPHEASTLVTAPTIQSPERTPAPQ